MTRPTFSVLAVAGLAFGAALPANAQRTTDPSGVAAHASRDSAQAPRTKLQSPRDTAWWVPLTSALVPGLGQRLLHQDRFIAYMAAELYGFVNQLNSQRMYERERDAYRTLARDVARAFVPGNQAYGDWDYYEAMEKRVMSGVFDRTPGTGTLSPEVDTATFNGFTWLKARELSNWPDVNVEPSHTSAAYQNAINYYNAHAVRPEYQWNWQNAQLEWDIYRRTIQRANDAHRDRERFLAVIAVNHVLSMVDAFAAVRLRGGAGAMGRYTLSATVPFR